MLLRGVSFPTPWETLVRLTELAGGERLSGHLLIVHIYSSLQRWLIGFGIAASLGVAYGLVAGRVGWFEKATAKIPQMLLLVPGLAWIPVAILLFGIGQRATIFMIAISAFAPIAVNVLSGIKTVDIHLIRAAQMMGAGKNDLFFRVLLPAALPSLLSGMRIGLGTGWRVLVAAEMVVGTGTGLGYSIIQSRWTLDYASSFACIAIICGIGLLFEHGFLRQLEKNTIERWALAEEKQ
jgi:NitT/TauT family transport system permease protein/taurine transport system permease protein